MEPIAEDLTEALTENLIESATKIHTIPLTELYIETVTAPLILYKLALPSSFILMIHSLLLLLQLVRRRYYYAHNRTDNHSLALDRLQVLFLD